MGNLEELYAILGFDDRLMIDSLVTSYNGDIKNALKAVILAGLTVQPINQKVALGMIIDGYNEKIITNTLRTRNKKDCMEWAKTVQDGALRKEREKER